jgi:hypothetical protein
MLLVALGGCGGSSTDGQGVGGGNRDKKNHPSNMEVRPIVIVLSQKKNGNDCVAKFGKQPQHAFNGDVIAWEFVNNCDAAQDVEVTLKPGTNNPFISSPPWTKNIKVDDTDSITLVIASDTQAAPAGTYSFGIKVGGKLYDPKLEIDP